MTDALDTPRERMIDALVDDVINYDLAALVDIVKAVRRQELERSSDDEVTQEYADAGLTDELNDGLTDDA